MLFKIHQITFKLTKKYILLLFIRCWLATFLRLGPGGLNSIFFIFFFIGCLNKRLVQTGVSMSKINLWSPILGGRAVTASCFESYFYTHHRSHGRRTAEDMLHASFLSSLFLFSFLGNVSHWRMCYGNSTGGITNMASVRCVCGRSAMGCR